MRCPTCKREFYPQPDHIGTYWEDQEEGTDCAFKFTIQQCPSCYETIVIRETGRGYVIGEKLLFHEAAEALIIYPEQDEFSVAPEVPTEFAADLQEACAALDYSAKASAALSRRLLRKLPRQADTSKVEFPA